MARHPNTYTRRDPSPPLPSDWTEADAAEVRQAAADGASAYTDGGSWQADPSIYVTPHEREAFKRAWWQGYEADHR